MASVKSDETMPKQTLKFELMFCIDIIIYAKESASFVWKETKKKIGGRFRADHLPNIKMYFILSSRINCKNVLNYELI